MRLLYALKIKYIHFTFYEKDFEEHTWMKI